MIGEENEMIGGEKMIVREKKIVGEKNDCWRK
jgi:hypothetical protein